MFSKMNCGWTRMWEKTQKVEWRTNLRDGEVDGHLFTRGMIEGFRIGEEGASLEIWSSWTAPPPGKWSWSCWMMWWGRSTREGTIYRTKRARANLTYPFTVSVKSEGTQVDMVTVCTIIRGLCGLFDRKRSLFGDILLCKISWSVHRQRLATVILPMSE